MRLSEMFFKPKYERIPVINEFALHVERITKPELNKIMRENAIFSGNDVQFKTKKIRTPIGMIEVSALSVALAKKIKGWEGLNGKTLKEILPDIQIDIPDDEEIEFEETGAILLVAFGVISTDDKIIPFEEFLLNHMNSLIANLESEVIEIEKK